MQGFDALEFLVRYWHILGGAVGLIVVAVETRTQVISLRRRVDGTEKEISDLRQTIQTEIKDLSAKIDKNHGTIMDHLLGGKK